MNKLSGLLFFFFFFSVSVFAQQTVKGKVTDEDGNAVPNANVMQSGNKSGGTQTGKDGTFSISVKGTGKITLVISSVGFTSKDVTVKGDEVNVVLEKKVSVQDEVVVIGYQSLKRKEIAGAATAVTSEQIKDVPASSSAAEALAGRAAGVVVTTAEGGPGADYDVKVRNGTSITQDNTPLYIVDGVPVENALSVIAPQDIQSFDILKDAAATAIYGSRGSNGVIVITTKGGKNNKKLTVSYNTFIGWKSLANELEVMSPGEFVEFQYERIGANLINSSDTSKFAHRYGLGIFNEGSNPWDTIKSYRNVTPIDWQKKLFGRKALQHSHNIALTGGNKLTSFSLSLTYNKEDGILLGSDFTKKLATLKLDHKLTKDIKIGGTFRLSDQALNGSGVSGDGLNFSRLRNAVKYVPFSNFRFIEDQDSDWDPDQNPGGTGIVNPVLSIQQDLKRNINTTLSATAFVQYSITKWLSFKSTVGYDQKNQFIKYFSDSATSYSRNEGGKLPISRLDSSIRKSFTNSNVITFNSNGLKSRFKKNHNLQVILGEETVTEKEDASLNIYKFYPHGADYNTVWKDYTGSYDLPDNSVPPGYPLVAKAERSLLSFFGKAIYNYKSKYFASFSYRADGSSKFAPGRRWGFFPAGSFAWGVSKEKFMDKVNFVSDLKLRLSYGESGNNKIPDYAFLPLFLYNNGPGYGLLDNIPGNVYYANTAFLANGLIKWETTVSKNIGLDFSLFKNALQFTVDLYQNESNDLLLKARVPSTTGYQEQYQNVASTVNRGVEIQVTAPKLFNSKDFNWSSTFNIAFNRNKVKSLGGLPERNEKSEITSKNPADYKIRVGEPLGQVFGYVNDGFYKASEFQSYDAVNNLFIPKTTTLVNNTGMATAQPGNIKFKDLDGNDTLDARDQTVIGNTNPKFTGGFSNQFTYKNFDLSVFVNWVVGNDVYNANKIEFTSAYQSDANFFKVMEGRWKTIDENGNIITDLNKLAERNKDAKIWRPLSVESFNAMSWAIEDASFLRLNNVTIGYTVKPKSKFIKSLRFYATGTNLAVFTSYTGYDPEVNAKRKVLTPGVDYSAYPKSRSYIFGINAGF